jgi:hypothetical protein
VPYLFHCDRYIVDGCRCLLSMAVGLFEEVGVPR